MITCIEFKGQQRQVKVSDPEIIGDFESAFKVRTSRLPATGTAYEVFITLATGLTVRTDIYLYKDHSGFAIADDTHRGAGDPRYTNVDLPRTLTKGTTDLCSFLVD